MTSSNIWPLIGRDDELAALQALFTEHRGTVVTLSGAAGVGKTRLAQAFRHHLDADGWDTAWVAASHAASGVPLGAFSHLLPVTDVPDDARGRLEVAMRVLRPGARPLLLVVDDAHLLDATSARLVRRLVADRRVALLVVSPLPLPMSGGGTDGRSATGPVGLSPARMTLEPLKPADVRRLIEVVLDGSVTDRGYRAIWRRSRGWPLVAITLALGSADAASLIQHDGRWHLTGRLRCDHRLVETVDDLLADLCLTDRRVLEIAVLEAGPARTEDLEVSRPETVTHLLRVGLVAAGDHGARSDDSGSVAVRSPVLVEGLRANTPACVRVRAGRRTAHHGDGAVELDDRVTAA